MPRSYRHLTFEERCQGVDRHSTATRPHRRPIVPPPLWDGRTVGEEPPGPARGDEPSQSFLCRSTLVAFPSLHDEKEFLQPTGGVKLRRRFTSSGVILSSFSTVLPKKGRLSKAELEREQGETFPAMHRQHPAVESAINNLEQRGLGHVRAKGSDGFVQTAALSVVALNLHRVGRLLREKARKRHRRAA